MPIIIEDDLPENVVSIERRSQIWNGITVEDIHEHAKGGVLHSMLYDNDTRLTINLEEVGGLTEPRLKQHQACTVDHTANHMALIPRGMHLWGFAKDLRYCRYGILIFDIPKLSERLEDDFTSQPFEEPRLRFMDPRILTLVRMLVGIPMDDSASTLLGDSLTAAVFALLSAPHHVSQEGKRLAPWQVRRVTEYMREQLPRQIELRELASLVGQSQWHFCRAFKASTGASPYQWQLDERIGLAQQLLLSSENSLDRVAAATGFGDSMHLIRTFKKRCGQTPGAWRRSIGVK
ncbi:helix-turn-helix transcriptional regulator [Agrobacterium vaccinii]|uniref:AraC family transcriptional regulator n=1 Tax=Agrobacterium vaccinii TaxID=2735528 RepID=UPI001E4359CC|nr:AraC family transcriptional regulator [Agrobacterium vaccinii]UHS61288.1 helix-turn-helix transcriptional regulator [Agrobacterium vaccinii]